MIREALEKDFQWLYQYYKSFLLSSDNLPNDSPFSKIMVYELNNKIIGFVNYSIIYDRAELDYIYVEESYRNNHIASELLHFCLNDVKSKKCVNITLEVNENNSIGIRLYEKYGFKVIAKRPRYYHGEDALLMIRELNENE